MRLLEGGDEDVRGEESMLRVLPVGKRLQVAEPAIFRAHNRQVADLNSHQTSRSGARRSFRCSLRESMPDPAPLRDMSSGKELSHADKTHKAVRDEKSPGLFVQGLTNRHRLAQGFKCPPHRFRKVIGTPTAFFPSLEIQRFGILSAHKVCPTVHRISRRQFSFYNLVYDSPGIRQPC